MKGFRDILIELMEERKKYVRLTIERAGYCGLMSILLEYMAPEELRMFSILNISREHISICYSCTIARRAGKDFEKNIDMDEFVEELNIEPSIFQAMRRVGGWD